jgi:nucleotide-binding universal stress UspA family protein
MLVPMNSRVDMARNLAADLARIVDELGPGRCTPTVTVGISVAESLLEAAQDARTDLIAIPSRSRGRVASALFGSTTDNVVKLAHLPVLVLPAQWLLERDKPAP